MKYILEIDFETERHCLLCPEQEKQDMFREVLRLSREEQDYVIQYDSTTDGEG